MKAVVLEAPATLVYREDYPLAIPGAADVRVRLRAASICGSDMLRVYSGHAKTYPLVPGHECAGIIDAIGDGVPAEWQGRAVAVAPLIPCHACVNCRRGLFASCQRYSFIGSRQAGAFAEYLAAPLRNVVALPPEVPLETAALIEPLTVALHALERGGGAAGRTVAIFGVGSIGLLTVLAARFLGAAQIIAVDVQEANLDFARHLGATHTLNARGDVTEALRRLTDGGADVALEVSGALAAVEQVVQAVRPGGAVVFVGNQPQDGALPSRLIEHIMRYQVNLHGAWMSYSAPFPGHEWTDAVQAIQQAPADFAALISHRVPLAGLPAMFDQMHRRAILYRKIMVTYDA
ncbi:MAG: galactitol-1-phosphate 5-dehydrogenase [Anaerolineae bacterium]|jgi:threonine dehydrogenase-like Zn-dependent dehydrogenase|nr:galactitol-1-phosphate 5-dehydrogenase [Anaerolineae bacterium]